MGNSIHRDLERDCDLLLDLLGGAARPLGDDCGVIVRDIGVGLHWKVVKGDCSPAEQEQTERNHHHPVVQREIYKSANHLLLLLGPDECLLIDRALQHQGIRHNLLARLYARFHFLHIVR